MDPDKIQKDKRFPNNFTVRVQLSNFCDCTTSTQFDQKCSDCRPHLEAEEKQWSTIYEILDKHKKSTIEESRVLLFGYPELDDVEEVLIGDGPVDIYVHGRRGLEADNK